MLLCRHRAHRCHVVLPHSSKEMTVLLRSIRVLLAILLIGAPASTPSTTRAETCGNDVLMVMPIASLAPGQTPTVLAMGQQGDLIARTEAETPVSAFPTGTPNRVLLQDRDQHLFIFDIDDGSLTPVEVTAPSDVLQVLPSTSDSSILVLQYLPEMSSILVDVETGKVDTLADRLPPGDWTTSPQDWSKVSAEGGLVALSVGNALFAGAPFSSEPLTLLDTHQTFPEAMMSPTGDQLAYRSTDTASGAQQIVVIDRNLNERRVIEGAETIWAFAFAGPDQLVGATDEGLQVIDLQTGTSRQVPLAAPAQSIWAVSPDGTRVLVGAINAMVLADLTTGETSVLPDVANYAWVLPEFPSITEDRIVADGSQTASPRLAIVDLLADPIAGAVEYVDSSVTTHVLDSLTSDAAAVIVEAQGDAQTVSVLNLATASTTPLTQTDTSANILVSPDGCQIAIGAYPEMAGAGSSVQVFSLDGQLKRTVADAALVGWAPGA